MWSAADDPARVGVPSAAKELSSGLAFFRRQTERSEASLFADVVVAGFAFVAADFSPPSAAFGFAVAFDSRCHPERAKLRPVRGAQKVALRDEGSLRVFRRHVERGEASLFSF
jgi:hypothetical protein